MQLDFNATAFICCSALAVITLGPLVQLSMDLCNSIPFELNNLGVCLIYGLLAYCTIFLFFTGLVYPFVVPSPVSIKVFHTFIHFIINGILIYLYVVFIYQDELHKCINVSYTVLPVLLGSGIAVCICSIVINLYDYYNPIEVFIQRSRSIESVSTV